MNSNVWSWVVLCLLGSGACFHDANALADGLETPRVVSVTVRDAAGSPWPLEGVPRHVRFELTFESALRERRSSPPLYLVRGLATDELVEDLADPPLRAATSANLLPITVDKAGRSLIAIPGQSLVAGSQYSLIWIDPEGPQVFTLTVSTSPAAGAALAQSFPSAQARDVPANIHRALLRFDGHLASTPEFTLQDATGALVELRVAPQDCEELGFGPGDCVWLRWSQDLHPQSLYTVASASHVLDATGAPVILPPLAFETGEGEDHMPPTLAKLACALDEQEHAGTCALAMDDAFALRAQANEPVFAELLALPARAGFLAALDPLQIELRGLAANTPCRFLRLTDLAENQLELPLCGALPSELATVTIDEVRADPLGPEPAQEYVELLNFGTKAVVVEGFSLTDDAFTKGHALSMPSPLLPGERVLAVGPDFDRHHPSDGSVPDALRLIRLAAPLSLSNDGCALFLRDAAGRRLSAAPRLGPDRAGQCVARVTGADARSARAEEFRQDPNGSCTPGTATPDQRTSPAPRAQP